MRMLEAPLVYVGPTLSREAVQELLPGCIVRPPVRRGDLYRDRLLRGSVFVLIDGVFHQQQAVSPREIIDVIADGAFVAGASSMGALRAAECWPAGMRGIGTVYRLFRSGKLESDDEVAVAFDPDDPVRSASLALINIRYALWRATRAGELSPERAAKVLGMARSLFYPERRWRTILRLCEARELTAQLETWDLKRADAVRALQRVKRWLRTEPSLCRRPRRGLTFELSEHTRERSHDVPGSDAKLELARWLLASGRYARWSELPREAALDEFAERAWHVLQGSGELDAELFRLHAITVAARRAREQGLVPQPIDWQLADQRIALEAPALPVAASGVRDELALALAFKSRGRR
jgi:hypothetical protein